MYSQIVVFFSGHEERKPVRSFIGSVEDPNIVRKACHGVTSVYHIAGLISYGTFPDYDAMERVNVQGSFCFIVLLYNITMFSTTLV